MEPFPLKPLQGKVLARWADCPFAICALLSDNLHKYLQGTSRNIFDFLLKQQKRLLWNTWGEWNAHGHFAKVWGAAPWPLNCFREMLFLPTVDMRLRPGAPHNAIEEDPFFLAARNSKVCWQIRPYVATSHHVRMWRAPKSLQLSVDDLEPVGDIIFLISYWTVDIPRGKPVPFNYGCFPQTYRDPEKAAEWKDLQGGWQGSNVNPTFDLFGRPMSFTLLRVMMIPWMCWAAQHNFWRNGTGQSLAIQDWFGWCTDRGWPSVFEFCDWKSGGWYFHVTPGGDHCTVPCLRCCLSYWWRPGAFREGLEDA